MARDLFQKAYNCKSYIVADKIYWIENFSLFNSKIGTIKNQQAKWDVHFTWVIWSKLKKKNHDNMQLIFPGYRNTQNNFVTYLGCAWLSNNKKNFGKLK
jgi:hypothetical protein